MFRIQPDPDSQHWFITDDIILGGWHPECATEAADLWHHQRAGGHRAHREEEQELHQVDGSRSWTEHTGLTYKHLKCGCHTFPLLQQFRDLFLFLKFMDKLRLWEAPRSVVKYWYLHGQYSQDVFHVVVTIGLLTSLLYHSGFRSRGILLEPEPGQIFVIHAKYMELTSFDVFSKVNLN